MAVIRSWLIIIQSFLTIFQSSHSIRSDKVLLVRVRDGQFLERLKFFPIVKDLNCEKFLYRTSLSLVYYLVIYIISQADIMSYFSGM